MKLVALWLATLTLAALTAASCSVNHRSGNFSCQTTADCADGRLCVDNVCVSTDPIDGGIDNPIDGGSNAGCPTACTSCDLSSKTCNIDCSQSNGCKFPVACPGGWNCDIKCNTNGSCLSGITCSDRDCKVECTGRNSCRNVACSTGTCEVECAGSNTCNTVQASAAKAATVNCTGTASCVNINGGSGKLTASCENDGTCNKVVCGTGRCDVDCIGLGSCATADCAGSCACDVVCDGSASCNNLTCGHKDACFEFDGCGSTDAGCNTCPSGN